MYVTSLQSEYISGLEILTLLLSTDWNVDKKLSIEPTKVSKRLKCLLLTIFQLLTFFEKVRVSIEPSPNLTIQQKKIV